MTLAVYRATLRLILRSFWIYAVTVPMLGLAWVAGMKCRGTTCLTEFFHQPFMMFFFLGQMLAAVASIQTERTQRAEEMLAALPGSTAATVAGRAGAIFTAWLAAGTLIFLTLILRGGLGDPLFTLLDWFLVLPLTLVFTTGVAYGVATWLRRGFTAYVVSLLIFLAATFPFNQLTSSIYRALTGAGPFSTLDFTLSSYFQLGGLPIFPDFWPLVFNRVHAIGVGLFWLALVIWMVGRRRREGVRKAAVVAIASLALVLISFTASRGVWAQRVYRSETERSGATASSGEAVPGLPAPVVDAFDLILSLDTAHSAMKATAELDVSQTGETAPFSLNRSFTVTAVTGPDGKAVPFARSGDLLLLTTEGRPGRYTVKYAGLVWQWRDDMWNGLRLAAHVAAGSVVLPQGMGWYPVPGHQTLTFVQRNRVYDTRIWHRP
ncbi:MAG TPA: hypothetical protein VNT75_05195, partial [Symbiobacteriaceae bacterium]|nr:hypothetical protein [Symbiobacteriaceae bacterium]